MFAVVILTGRLVEPPAIRRLANGENVARLSVSVLSRTTELPSPVSHRVVVHHAETVRRLLEPEFVAGAMLQVAGELDYYHYTSGSGGTVRHHRLARVLVAPPFGSVQIVPGDPPPAAPPDVTPEASK